MIVSKGYFVFAAAPAGQHHYFALLWNPCGLGLVAFGRTVSERGILRAKPSLYARWLPPTLAPGYLCVPIFFGADFDNLVCKKLGFHNRFGDFSSQP